MQPADHPANAGRHATNPATRTGAWREVMALFERWSDEPSLPGREALIAQTQSQRPELAARLLALIAADEAAQAGDFLGAGPAIDPVPQALGLAPRAGTRLGAWALAEPIGEGGMGEVWLASRADGLYQGQAAIKLLHGARPGTLADARFAREGELLARLAHPHIARLLDAGTADGGARYLVLEHVQGTRIDTWCDERRLDLAGRLRLMLQVCEAVAYAHANLIVHRDLKPANILVTADGQAKLLDFGVAKLLGADADQSELTRAASAGLTPEYAAPEQVSGGVITTATDVYALGVLLFGLLCGSRPYGAAAGTPAQLAREIVEAEPRGLAAAEPSADAAAARGTTPQALRQALRGDLEQIVARALRKLPAERYASVQSLAEDIGRNLNHQPVSAHAPGWGYRSAKFVRRHRLPLAASTLVAAALVAGSGVALWQARAARHEAARAEGVKNFLTGLLADTNVDKRGAQAGGMTVSDLLDAAESRVQAGLAAQPEVRDEVYLLLTELQAAQGRTERAIALAGARVAAAEAAFGRDDPRLAPGLIYHAATLVNSGEKIDQALTLLGRAQALLDAAGDERSMTRAQLWMWQGGAQRNDTAPSDKKARYPWEGNPASKAVALLRSHHRQSDEYLIALQFANSFAHLVHDRNEDALKLADEMLGAVRERYGDSHGLVSRAHNARALALGGLKRFDEAYEALALGRNHAMKYLPPSHPDIFSFTMSMATVRFDGGRKDEARALLAEARALVQAHHQGSAPIVERLRLLAAKMQP